MLKDVAQLEEVLWITFIISYPLVSLKTFKDGNRMTYFSKSILHWICISGFINDWSWVSLHYVSEASYSSYCFIITVLSFYILLQNFQSHVVWFTNSSIYILSLQIVGLYACILGIRFYFSDDRVRDYC